MAKKKEDSKTKDGINFNDKVKNGKPYWFQIMVNGKRVTRRGFRTFTEAKNTRAALMTELNRGEYIDPARTTYGEYFAEWLEGRDNIQDTTKDLYQSFFDRHIKEGLGEMTLSKMTAMDIKKFITNLRKKGLGDESVKRIFATVNASLNHAETMEIIAKNPANKIPKDDRPKVERKERQIWSNESVKQVLSNGKGKTRFWIAFFLAIMTGMRQGEILGLKWSDIDFERSLLRVRRSLRKDKVIFKKVKNDSSVRIVALSPLTLAFLEEHRSLIEDEKKMLEAKGGKYEDNDLVVCSSLGTPARASKVLAAWYNICDKYKPAHEPRITYHDLRHQSASIMLNEREDIRVVSQRLGHSNVNTTLRVYSHLLPNAQESAAAALDRVVGLITE
ncbi:MAG: tyrosine-type recombinase/integrase [Bacillota bacterium]